MLSGFYILRFVNPLFVCYSYCTYPQHYKTKYCTIIYHHQTNQACEKKKSFNMVVAFQDGCRKHEALLVTRHRKSIICFWNTLFKLCGIKVVSFSITALGYFEVKIFLKNAVYYPKLLYTSYVSLYCHFYLQNVNEITDPKGTGHSYSK